MLLESLHAAHHAKYAALHAELLELRGAAAAAARP